MKSNLEKYAGIDKYAAPIPGFLSMAANATGSSKLGKIAGIANSALSVGESVAGAKMPKMRKGGKMKGKKC